MIIEERDRGMEDRTMEKRAIRNKVTTVQGNMLQKGRRKATEYKERKREENKAVREYDHKEWDYWDIRL